MKSLLTWCAWLFSATWALAGGSDKTLDVYWIDSEGGGSTLLVTPAGESVLIDTGNPGGRDAPRIAATARAAGLKRLDHVLITHFHIDHFGGAAELAALMPIGTLYDRGLPVGDPDGRAASNFPLLIKPYKEMTVGNRVTVTAGSRIALKPTAETATLSLRCLAADQVFVPPTAEQSRVKNPLAGSVPAKPEDRSDNANSAVFLIEFGGFRFFDGGDLSWNVEDKLVSPHNLVGIVDVYQVNHHGLDASNNPILLRSLAPTVAVLNNGPKKGAEPGTMATLKALPSLQGLWAVHRNVRVGPEGNAATDHTANAAEPGGAEPDGNVIKMSVARDGQSYTVSIPNTGFSRTYATRAK